MGRNISNKCFLFFIALSLFCITRQVPFQQLSFLIAPLYIVAMFFSFKDIRKNILKEKQSMRCYIYMYVLFFSLMLFYSIVLSNEFFYALQSYAVVVLLVFSYYIKPNKDILKIFIFISILHAIVLIGLNYFFVSSFDHENYIIRAIFSENEYGGDVYFFNDYLCRIIMKGNELIPFALMLVEIKYKGLKKYILLCIFLIALIIAGNFAYYMSLFVFYILLWLYEKKYIKVSFAFISLIVFFVIFNTFFSEYISDKQDSSWPTRIDQIDILLDDFDSNTDYILGKGMGNTVNLSGEFRNYSGNRYFEVQAMYFFNQLGILGMFFVIVTNIILSIKYFKSSYARIIYIAYLLYALTNPYVFNIVHLIVINTLVSVPVKLEQNTFKACHGGR